MNVKINNNNYEVPQLGFGEMVKMESVSGTSLVSMFQKQQVFILAEAFVATVVGCGKEEADRLCEQHVMGGGTLEDIYAAFSEAVDKSGFFKQVLGKEKKPGAGREKKEISAGE